jgi:hypothetical protein
MHTSMCGCQLIAAGTKPTTMRVASWAALTTVYTAGIAFLVWLVLAEPVDEPRRHAYALAFGAAGILAGLYVIAALPFWLSLRRPFAHGMAALLSAIGALAAFVLTWGAAFVNGYVLGVLAFANAYAALRGGFDRREAVTGVAAVAVIAFVFLALASVWLAVLLSLVAAGAAVHGLRSGGQTTMR